MSIAHRIEHTNLKADASAEDIKLLCTTAMNMGFRAVCVNGRHINLAKQLLVHSSVALISVVDFPLGASVADTKIAAILRAKDLGADELDVVWDITSFLSGDYNKVQYDLDRIVDAAGNIPVKIIVETCFLPPTDFDLVYDLVKESGAKYIVTSTGHYLQDEKAYKAIKCWAKKEGLSIKANGGIRNFAVAEEFITIGADLLGTSSGVEIICREKESNHV